MLMYVIYGTLWFIRNPFYFGNNVLLTVLPSSPCGIFSLISRSNQGREREKSSFLERKLISHLRQAVSSICVMNKKVTCNH